MGWLNIVFEVILLIGLIIGFIHEDEIIELETVLKQFIQRKLRIGKYAVRRGKNR